MKGQHFICCSLSLIDIELYSTRMTSASEKLKTVIHNQNKVQKRNVTFETSIICQI